MLRARVAPVLVALALAMAAAAPARAEGPVNLALVQAGFEALPDAQRRQIQELAATTGLYGGAIDGRYGPGTQGAVVGLVPILEGASYDNRFVFDLASPQGVAAFYQVLLTDGPAWAYGEGEECDGC